MKSVVLGVVLMALGLAACSEPKVVPQLNLQDLDGNKVALQDLHGQPVVVNLWATWCAPCRREMPLLQQAQKQHPDVAFVLINQGEKADAVERYLAKEQLSLQHVWLDEPLQSKEALGYEGLPSTYFLNSKGQLMNQLVGELEAETLEKELKAIKP